MSSFSVRSRIHNPWRTMLSLEGETIIVRRQGATPTPNQTPSVGCAVSASRLRRVAVVSLPRTAKAAERFCVFLKVKRHRVPTSGRFRCGNRLWSAPYGLTLKLPCEPPTMS